MERFERSLQNHYFFARKNQQTNTYRKELFTGKSQWNPPNPDANISRRVGDLNIELLDTRKHKLRYNLDIKTRTAMKKLKENKNIIIKKADKGGGIVIMNTSDYVEKIHTMLADPETYEKVDNDKTQQIWTACNQLISSTLYDNYKINSKQLKYLTQFIARCPVFYGLPKIHKTNWPLRPIVSQIQGPLSKLNEVVDTLLKPCTSYIVELLQDTTQFLQLIEQNQKLPEKHPELRLVTVDVTALYTNIPHEEGAKWVAEYYMETLPKWEKKHPEIKPISGENLETMIRFILENNVFEFLGEYYKQKIGTTMGAQFSVNYANIYMHKFFRIFNRTYNYDLPTAFGRFVDDVFFIWSQSSISLQDYLHKLNTYHSTIKFTHEISTTTVNFLDTSVYISAKRLHTTLYTKTTDKKKYLLYSSSHPKHILKAIPYSQAIRTKRIVSDTTNLQNELDRLKQKFTERGYPERLINKQLERLNQVERLQLLEYKQKPTTTTFGKNTIPMIITFQQQYLHSRRTIHQITTDWWKKLLNTNQSIQNAFKDVTLKVVFSNNKTLTNELIRSRLTLEDNETTHRVWTEEDNELVEILHQLQQSQDTETRV